MLRIISIAFVLAAFANQGTAATPISVLGSSWRLTGSLSKDWVPPQAGIPVPIGMVFLTHRQFLTCHMAAVVLSLESGLKDPAKVLCDDAKKQFDEILPANDKVYNIVKIKNVDVCEITSKTDGQPSVQLLMPGKIDFVQMSFYYGKSPRQTKKIIDDIIARLEPLP